MNNTGGKTRSGDRDPSRSDKDAGANRNKTPNADMQAQDAGTADSGTAASGTSAEPAMKQTSKTASERGSKR